LPPIEKARRRDDRRRKARNSKFQNVRYSTLRAGESLAAFEADRKTTVEGKKPKRGKRKRRF
jgi:hypothetical protein